MGAWSDVVNMGGWNRMRMWLLAIAVATAGAGTLELAALVGLSKTISTVPRFTWLSYILGGLLFGIGMTLGSGCGSRTLIRIGTGNLKSLVVAIVLAITAYMTLKGILGVLRVAALDSVSATLAGEQGLASILARSLATKSFRLESFRDAEDLINHLVGGALMGFGGVLALGCTIGQGVSGLSTLALGSFLAFFAIIAGAALTMKVQYWRLMRQA